jgi:hypothetical protein
MGIYFWMEGRRSVWTSGGDSMEAVLVAKKKTPAAPEPGPKPRVHRVRDATTNIRSTQEWKAWVDELADFDRAPSVNDLVDRALVSYAREVKFPKPAPKR